MSEYVTLKEDLDHLKADVDKIGDRQRAYASAHHKLEIEVVEVKADVKHIRKGQEAMNANMTRLMFIVVGSFAAAIIGFIVRGGLT